MRVQVQNLKKGQTVYDDDPDDSYKVYSAPKIIDGKWEVEVTTSGDYAWVFTEDDKLWDNPDRQD